MKYLSTFVVGLALSLVGGVAFAQTQQENAAAERRDLQDPDFIEEQQEGAYEERINLGNQAQTDTGTQQQQQQPVDQQGTEQQQQPADQQTQDQTQAQPQEDVEVEDVQVDEEITPAPMGDGLQADPYEED